MKSTVVGIFGSMESAQRAREALLAHGIDEVSVTLSIDLTADGVAAESPGQSFENQPGQSPSDSRAAASNEAVRSGVCTLTVDGPTGEVETLLRAGGARNVTRLQSP